VATVGHVAVVINQAIAILVTPRGVSVVGIVRVRKDRQCLWSQQEAGTAAERERLFTDRPFGVRDDRSGSAALLDFVRAG
jgi:hypothetical protein